MKLLTFQASVPYVYGAQTSASLLLQMSWNLMSVINCHKRVRQSYCVIGDGSYEIIQPSSAILYGYRTGTLPSLSLQYIPRNMRTVFAWLCFVVVIHWLIFPYPPGLLHWHCGNLCPSAGKATLMNMDKYFMLIHYERLHNHNKAKHNKIVCIFLGYTVPA